MLPLSYFFPSTSGIVPFWTTQGLPSASPSWNGMMVLCDLKSLITCKQNTVRSAVMKVGKLLHQERSSSSGRLTWRNLAYCTAFSLNCCENSDVHGTGSSCGRADAPKESACGACSNDAPPSSLGLLAVGFTSSKPLGRREILSCLYHLTLHPNDLPSSGASWC